jgi:hypothetical protein
VDRGSIRAKVVELVGQADYPRLISHWQALACTFKRKTMKYPVIAFTRLLGAVALSTLIAACGSSGGDDDDAAGGGLVVPSDTFRVTCTVIDTAAALVEGAVVTFNIEGINPSPSTTTGADGKCVPLDIKAADVTGLTQVAASVIKAGYEPGQFTCPVTTGGTTCNGAVALRPLATNTSLPGNGDVVTHIGDGIFDGTINSQFQTDAVGLSADFPIADWATKLQANPGWTRATVVLDAKGWQTTIAPTCKNTIAMVDSGGVVKQSQPGGDSSATGEWSSSTFDFDVATVGTSGPVTLRITAGTCNTPAKDVDDFETNRIRVYYCDATTIGPCAPKP